ncbi:Crp/Fnr family transcriptional regulator [Chitinimonas sp. PSY-7]|uniref:cyclic nucleotide-binding domain-containing protein n=1 Tax=Chitinimonas sp. PSY-7 TaxID=3459088 RepID=UPI00403FEEAD
MNQSLNSIRDCSNTTRTSFHFLDSIPLLQGLSPELLAHIKQHAVPWESRNGKLLFFKGEPENFIAFVLHGSVYHSLHEPDGREVIIDHSSHGEVLGEAALIQPHRRSYNATLSQNCRLLLLHRPHFAALQADPAFITRVQQQLCTRLKHISDFVETVCLYPLETRLARHLLVEIEHHGKQEPDGIVLPMPISQSILAAMLNISRPRLNTQLQLWQRAGLIQQQRHALKVNDLQRLRRIALQENNAK